jgi:gluconolactonase
MKKFIFMAAIFAAGCTSTKEFKSIGSIEKLDESLSEIIDGDAKIEILGEGYTWSEGPVWIASENMLLFSDVPENKVYKWTEDKGVELYLTPSGFTGTNYPSTEPGSNGLTLDREGKLVLCQHGDRRVARMDAPFDKPTPNFISLADQYNGKKLNSPNDVVFRSNGDFFFTDPPYGLPGREVDSVYKEQPSNGVYKVSANGTVTLLVDSVSRPNGIALTPDEKTLIVANSDPTKAVWYAFDIGANDSLSNARILFDATAETKTSKGLPDGFKIDKKGNIFASGPGGVWIFNSSGKVIGKIKLPEATANTALADDDKTLYITSDMYLLRVKLR